MRRAQSSTRRGGLLPGGPASLSLGGAEKQPCPPVSGGPSADIKSSGQKESRTVILFHLLVLIWLVPTLATKPLELPHAPTVCSVCPHTTCLPFLCGGTKVCPLPGSVRPVLVNASHSSQKLPHLQPASSHCWHTGSSYCCILARELCWSA